ncbi:MAG: ComF family protein, partial [Planctomycetota bacterium JB042]
RRAVAGLRYGGPARDVVLAVKFSGRREGLRVLAEGLGRALVETGLARRVSLVVPVPLHPWRRLGRGFDQAEELARLVGRALGLPVVAGALRRRRLTSPQARRAPGERAGAMERAFGRGARSRRVRGRAVLLIDDVMTSGATADAAAGALLDAGARAVFVGVAAT